MIIRLKEVVVYPNGSPEVGEGLNRKALVTLHQVWPNDKALHVPIKDRERLEEMNYEAELRTSCDGHDSRFVEYRPETGSWSFEVKHFSKYSLRDDVDDKPIEILSSDGRSNGAATNTRKRKHSSDVSGNERITQFFICLLRVILQ